MKKENYGRTVQNLKIDGEKINYPVVNERVVRGAAGLMFLIGISTFFYIRLTGDYLPIYYVVPLFWAEFFLKVVFGPQASIFAKLAKFFVGNQKPEYVGAIQKRFAWALGLFLASSMFIVAIVLGIKGWVPFAICMTCLIFMWLESSFGICVGCRIYYFLVEKGWIESSEQKMRCPGGACPVRVKK